MLTKVHRRAMLAGMAALAAPGCSQSPPDKAPIIAAAADLQFALTDIAARFEQQTSNSVRLNFGSTGNFARQIREGAPFELFLAADEKFILDLAADGFTQGASALYAIGRIVMLVPNDAPLAADSSLESLRAALAAGQISRFAIANPDHAPYGQRAEEALRHAGLWDAIQPHLVLGENVAQAAQFALSGNAEGGIIAYSLALSPDIARRSRHALIPAAWHAPLRQRMALLKPAGPVATAFYAYMQSPDARAVMARYGFARPAA